MKFFVVLLILNLVLSPFVSQMMGFVSAQSSSEIQGQIINKEKELSELEKTLNSLRRQEQNIIQDLSSSVSEIDRVVLEIEKIKNELEIVLVNLEDTALRLEIQKLRRIQLENLIDQNSKSTYKNWRANNSIQIVLDKNSIQRERVQAYDNFLSNQLSQDSIKTASILLDLVEQIEDLEKLKENRQSEVLVLQTTKAELEAKLASLKNQRFVVAGQFDNLSNNINRIKGEISFLSEEQRRAIERERQILDASPINPPSSPPPSQQTGDFYIAGRGRDLYQGHGVGMSQWGAHGMGLNGFTANQIISFYYSNVSIIGGYQDSIIQVHGYGAVNIEDYVSGQAEVPAKVCGTPEQAALNPQKYVIDNPNTLWDCWPEEAIKAQAIAFRTYALNYVARFGSICVTASCQVYNGSNASRWASEETLGQVILHNGNVIEALYSSDNNQGFGTANNDTVFNNFFGDGTPYAYLRAVNDNQYATRTSFTDWTYSTQRYTPQSIYDMLLFTASSSSSTIDPFSRSQVSNITNSINGVSSVTLERDPSNRVKRILLVSPNGNHRYISGYWFKYIWNVWMFDIGARDYIYSQTFNILN